MTFNDYAVLRAQFLASPGSAKYIPTTNKILDNSLKYVLSLVYFFTCDGTLRGAHIFWLKSFVTISSTITKIRNSMKFSV